MTSAVAARLADAEPTAEEIAAFLDAERTGPNATVEGVNALDSAAPDELAFCRYEGVEPIRDSDAGVVVCPESTPPLPGRALVHSPRPKADFVAATREFFWEPPRETRIHPTAVVADGATIGDRCRIGPNAYVGEAVRIGDRCTVRAGAAIGGPGFGFVREESGRPVRQPHVGSVVLEDDVAVGANCSIDRGVFGDTVLRRGAKLSGNVHVAHRAEIGEDVTVAAGCVFAGGSSVGPRAEIHPHVAVATDVSVGADAEVGMHSTVLEDVPPETTVVGTPAAPIRDA